MPDEPFLPVVLVPIGDLTPHPRNPQQGDVKAVAAAIAADGWHGTVTVRKLLNPVELQILVGHTRWRALQKLQADGATIDGTLLDYDALAARVALPPAGQVPIQIVEVDDVAAVRKMLADNRASALSLVDTSELQSVLAELAAVGALYGSLYDAKEYDRLANAAERFARDTASEGLTPGDRLAAFKAAGLRSVILPMDAPDYDVLTGQLNRLREAFGVATVSEAARRAVQDAVTAIHAEA